MSLRKSPLILALGLAGPALAGPGDHIRAGDATLVPSLDLGGEYRTNLYRSEADPTGGANLRIAPQASVTAAGEDHAFKASGIWELRKFLFVQTEPGDTLSGAERVASLDRFNDFGLSAGASLFKRDSVGFELSDNLNMRNNSTDAEFAETPFTTQLRNNLSGALRIAPGPALNLTPGALWSFNQYRVPGDVGERLLNTRHTYGPTLGAAWAFLPRTSLVFDARYMMNRWQDGPIAEDAGNAISVPDSEFITSMVGLEGRFTERLFLNLGAGYGVGLYDEGVNAAGLDGLLLRAEGRYQLREASEGNPGTSWTLGYDKQFRDSFFTNYIAVNRLYTGVSAGVGNFQPAIRYEMRFEGYEGAVVRQDIVNIFNADLTYRLQEWASVTPGVAWQQRASNVDNVEYDDVNIHLRATFTY